MRLLAHSVLVLLLHATVATAKAIETIQPGLPQWTLVWADEFDGKTLNKSNWEPLQGDGRLYGLPEGWGNDEKQYYTEEALVVTRGELIISVTPRYNHTFSSGRVRSLGLAEFTYGRIEARMKLPGGTGVWPGFWLLPSVDKYGPWASSGEIDIMESVGDMTEVMGTLHEGGSWPTDTDSLLWPQMNALACSGGAGCVARLPNGRSFSEQYHVFAVEWEADEIRWYADDRLFCRKHNWYSDAKHAPFPAPFDVPFHIILNAAVGGGLGGVPDQASLPAHMRVDYVRWYQRDTAADPTSTAGVPPTSPALSLVSIADVIRLLLLVAVPAISAALLAATGFDGLPILSAGWSVCMLDNDCGDSAQSSAAREAIRLSAALALPLALLQVWRLRRKRPAAHNRSSSYFAADECAAGSDAAAAAAQADSSDNYDAIVRASSRGYSSAESGAAADHDSAAATAADTATAADGLLQDEKEAAGGASPLPLKPPVQQRDGRDVSTASNTSSAVSGCSATSSAAEAAEGSSRAQTVLLLLYANTLALGLVAGAWCRITMRYRVPPPHMNLVLPLLAAVLCAASTRLLRELYARTEGARHDGLGAVMAGAAGGLLQTWAGVGGSAAAVFATVVSSTEQHGGGWSRWRALGAAGVAVQALPRAVYFFDTGPGGSPFARPIVLLLALCSGLWGLHIGNAYAPGKHTSFSTVLSDCQQQWRIPFSYCVALLAPAAVYKQWGERAPIALATSWLTFAVVLALTHVAQRPALKRSSSSTSSAYSYSYNPIP